MWRGNQETTGIHLGPAEIFRHQREQLHQWRWRDGGGGHLPGGGDRPARPCDRQEWRTVRIRSAGEALLLQTSSGWGWEKYQQSPERGPWRQTDPTSNWVSVTVWDNTIITVTRPECHFFVAKYFIKKITRKDFVLTTLLRKLQHLQRKIYRKNFQEIWANSWGRWRNLRESGWGEGNLETEK